MFAGFRAISLQNLSQSPRSPLQSWNLPQTLQTPQYLRSFSTESQRLVQQPPSNPSPKKRTPLTKKATLDPQFITRTDWPLGSIPVPGPALPPGRFDTVRYNLRMKKAGTDISLLRCCYREMKEMEILPTLRTFRFIFGAPHLYRDYHLEVLQMLTDMAKHQIVPDEGIMDSINKYLAEYKRTRQLLEALDIMRGVQVPWKRVHLMRLASLFRDSEIPRKEVFLWEGYRLLQKGGEQDPIADVERSFGEYWINEYKRRFEDFGKVQVITRKALQPRVLDIKQLRATILPATAGAPTKAGATPAKPGTAPPPPKTAAPPPKTAMPPKGK